MPVNGLQYLSCIEVPAFTHLDDTQCTDSGTETFGSTSWYAYNTTTLTRRVATHTYSYNARTYRNYTVMVDQTKRCPLWVAYPMHKVAYPSNSLGRAGSFSDKTSYDPAFQKSWQSSGSTSDYNNAEFRTTIDAIETRTGFDFFPSVPSALQNAAENSTASLW